nr:immunoglobulin heavy chain junction region [Macaca mulatta]MOW24906.1 immunoglobulin heavy chain junction region [Macaca mulatta]MOW25231.1 immunoglobulin heavy chain junction region [Macaca mulatta]MOW26378.1 immunoglobulin heavy chain junction region [Macaca mulatta]
CLAAFSWNDFW